MYVWYGQAQVCYAYLDDVAPVFPDISNESNFSRTLWATRGWTLQELLAPSRVMFYARDWTELGSKHDLSYLLTEMTSIEEDFLLNRKPLEAASIAKRMSWAARRITARPEDIAYCLMGIFSVNMPMLYGEGEKAFLRLQEEIMKVSDDHSLFAWMDEKISKYEQCGLLAEHPSKFTWSQSAVSYRTLNFGEPYAMTNKGIRLELPLCDPDRDGIQVATLNCLVPSDVEDSTYLGVYLKKLKDEDSQYARTNAGRLSINHSRGQLQTIYIRQNVTSPAQVSIYPFHII